MELDGRLKQKVADYVVPPHALDPIRHAPLVFMVGITAAGKNAVLHRLLQKHPDDYYFLVSHTSRPPRLNHGELERDGAEYHFVDLAAIDNMLDAHAFIEAQVIHSAWVYGSSIGEVMRAQQQGKIAVSDLDVQGIDTYVDLGLNLKAVFVLPPSYEIWMERLLARYKGKPHLHDLALRMRSAVKEIEHLLAVDQFYIVINDELEKTVELVNQIAHGEPVPPHYPKARATAEQLLARIRAELARIV